METKEERHIAHFDLDCFFVSVERLKEPSLQNLPVIVGGSGGRGVVSACSYETRKFGVHSAMPMRQARQLCPQAIIVKGDYASYSHYSRMVTDILRDAVPVLEKASIDEFYADLSGMDRFFGCAKFVAELRDQIVRETGLPISYALASNKLVSKIATNEVKPAGAIVVPYGTEQAYLAPLDITRMPGIGDKSAKMLRQMGVDTLKMLSEVPPAHLARFGKLGPDLIRRARGIDNSAVIPYHEQKSISKEDTFHADTVDVDFLFGKLIGMTESLAYQLRRHHRFCGSVAIKFRYSNFDTYTRQTHIPYTASDVLLIRAVKELFIKAYDQTKPLRLLGVRFADFVQGEHQTDLFTQKEDDLRLYKALDSIKDRFGEKAVMRGGGHSRSDKQRD